MADLLLPLQLQLNPQSVDVQTQNGKEILFVMMETTMPDVPLMEVTAVVIMSIPNTAKFANVSKEQQVDANFPIIKEMVTVMMETTIMDVHLMKEIVVAITSILNIAMFVNAFNKLVIT